MNNKKGKKSRTVSLASLFSAQQAELAESLDANSKLSHPTSHGDATEADWLNVLDALPDRYRCARATVIDCHGKASDLVDIVIYDRHFSPLLFRRHNELYVPAESVYAALEVRPKLSKANITYGGAKVASVRRLERTSVPITHAGGTFAPKPPFRIIGGLLTARASWRPAFGQPFKKVISGLDRSSRLGLGCCLGAGSFEVEYSEELPPRLRTSRKRDALIDIFVTLLGRLQALGTVPAMNLAAYAKAYRQVGA